MVASIGAVASPFQGVTYYERDGYYAKDDPAHKESSAWAGKGAEKLGLEGPVDPGIFKAILEGKVPGGPRLGRPEKDGAITHRPGRDITLSAPKSVSLTALIGGDGHVTEAHDRAVQRTLAWVEKNVVETRPKDPETGRQIRVGGQNMVAATFRHDASRNLDPQLHTHAVLANMVQGGDGKWRTMANEKLYASKMLIGALYRGELARELGKLGYAIEKTHADGRFEIAGVPRKVIEAFSTRRAEIAAAMAERGLGDPAQNQRLAQRAALMTRSHKREVDKGALQMSWKKQATDLGFDAPALAGEAAQRQAGKEIGRDTHAAAGEWQGSEQVMENDAGRAVVWAVSHLAERAAVFSRAGLLAAALAWQPGAVTIGEAERAVARLEQDGTLHAANLPVAGDSLTTDKAVAEEQETIAFRLEDGRTLELGRNDPQLRHLDHAWAATVHAFQGRTVDNVIAVMEANHPHLTTQKSFYVEISRARHRAELVTDDATALREHLETATGERVSALEGIGAVAERSVVRDRTESRVVETTPDMPAETPDKTQEPEPAKAPEPKRIEYDLGL